MDSHSAASMDNSSDKHLENLIETARFLGVSLNDLLDLSINKQATSGGTTSTHDENSRISYPRRPISHCDGGLLAGMQKDSSFRALPEHSLQSSLPPDPGSQVGEMSNNDYIPALEVCNSIEIIGNHFEPVGRPRGWPGCDEDYSFTWNDSSQGSLNRSQPTPLEESDNSSLVFNDSSSASLDLSRRFTPEGSDDTGWIQITPQWSGDSAESNGSSESSTKESPINDESNLPSPRPPFRSPHRKAVTESASPNASRNLQLLAPKLADTYAFGSKYVTGQSSLETINNTLLNMVQLNANRFISRKDLAQKKKRSPYIDSRVRKETFLTRQMNACVRCRMQRNRCIPDPTNPTGPCKPCQEKLARMTRLPCLRYKVTDSILFRTGLDYMPFYKRHPMNGPTYGDFHINKEWVSATTRLLDITQDRGPVPLTLEVREFKPPSEENALDLKGRSMYYIPWAIVDAESAVRAVNAYADANVESYLDALLDDSNHLVWDVFHAAIRLSVFPTPNKLLRNVLRLWVVCRFIESGWRVCGNETLNAETLKDPFYDWISPPPYIDYQFASTVIQRVLEPLRLETLRGLQTLVLSNKPSNWYQIFLVSFILLHNYELQVLFQRQFAARRKAKVRYLDMPLVRATHSGAKTILAHFHYGCKGQRPFREDFDWKAPQVRKMAQLDTEQSLFMERYKEQLNRNIDSLRAINRTDKYEDKYWFVSQLFEEDWSPRDTCEHSPPA